MKGTSPTTPSVEEQIRQAHDLYAHLTGQKLILGYDRQRMWFEWWRSGFDLKDLRRVIGYLQREIRQGRRNVGALKLRNLLQPDGFEEDLNISRVRLYAPAALPAQPTMALKTLSPEEAEQGRQQALRMLAELKQSLR